MARRVRDALSRFVPDGPEEVAAYDACLGLAEEADAWSRASVMHFTASALVLHPPSGRLLLRYHGRHERWMQVGGHGDPGEDDPFAIARREAEEETGLFDLTAWPPGSAPRLVQVALVEVPAAAGEDAHLHADLRCLLATATPLAARPESPGTPLRWCTLAEAGRLVEEPNLAVLFGRAAALGALS